MSGSDGSRANDTFTWLSDDPRLMSAWSPPTLPRSWLLLSVVPFVAWLAYSLVIIEQLLLGVLPLFAFVAFYLGWRFLAAFEAIADAQQRLADHHERDET